MSNSTDLSARGKQHRQPQNVHETKVRAVLVVNEELETRERPACSL